MMNCSKLKKRINQRCGEILQHKLLNINNELKHLSQAIADDTKSSAGDKYETAREMANIEINKLQSQLSSMNKAINMLNTLPVASKNKVAVGSLIKTDSVNIFLSVSLGQIDVNGEQILVISPMAPLAQILLGKKENDRVSFNDKAYHVLALC